MRDAPHRANAALVVAALVVVTGLVVARRDPHLELPLRSEAVVLTERGRQLLHAPQLADLVAGTRVLRPRHADPAAEQWARRASESQLAWLERGRIPGGARGPHADMVRTSLLDLHVLMDSSGGMLAGWSRPWRYVWPRDAAFAAVAFARSDHADDAVRVLAFLQRRQREDGLFEARYLADGSGVPDSRGVQLDGTGWVLWAADQVLQAVPRERRSEVVEELGPLLRRSTRAAMRLVDAGASLPPPSPDFWEVPEKTVTLGTAAPLLAGLESASAIWRAAGRPHRSAQCAEVAGRLRTAMRHAFEVYGYPRHAGGGELDAAVTFLLPPFRRLFDQSVLFAWRRAQVELRRPAGGLAPGAGWPSNGISWTPTTALFAVTAAGLGDRRRALAWLDWLAAHRTRAGALPEKVLHDGSPAAVAPLAWTCALVVIAADLLEEPPTGRLSGSHGA